MGAVTVKPACNVQGRPVPSQSCLSALETLYPRICAALVQLWFRDEIDTYLDSLILDDRFDRRGFPYEVIDELLFLSELRWTMSHPLRATKAVHRDGDDYTFQAGVPLVTHKRSQPTAKRI